MPDILPDRLDPWRAVKSRATFAGRCGLGDLARLSAVVSRDGDRQETLVQYDLAFGRDEGGRAVVTGEIRTRLRLVCQRCLGEVEFDLDLPLRVVLLRVGQSGHDLPDDLDPVVVDEDGFRLLDLIEDEILLAIPPVARHEAGYCSAPATAESVVEPGSDVWSPEEEPRPNPFAILAASRAGDPGSSGAYRSFAVSIGIGRRSQIMSTRSFGQMPSHLEYREEWQSNRIARPLPSVVCVVHTTP